MKGFVGVTEKKGGRVLTMTSQPTFQVVPFIWLNFVADIGETTF